MQGTSFICRSPADKGGNRMVPPFDSSMLWLSDGPASLRHVVTLSPSGNIEGPGKLPSILAD